MHRIAPQLLAVFLASCTSIFGASSCATAPGSSGQTLSVNFAAVSEPLVATREGAFFFVDAEVPGRGTLRLLVDTGAESTFLNTDAARRLFGSDVRRSSDRVRSANWTTTSLDGVVTIDRLEIGPISASRVEAPVLSLAAIERSLRTRIDGILGWDVLRHGVIELDYSAGTMRVLDPADTEPMDHAASAPLDRYGVAVTTISVNRAKVPVVIDTGSDGTIAVASLGRLPLLEGPRDGGAVRSIGGVRRVQVARLDGRVTFAGAVLTEPMLETTEGLPRIGAAAMTPGRLTLDGPRKRVQFTR